MLNETGRFSIVGDTDYAEQKKVKRQKYLSFSTPVGRTSNGTSYGERGK
jgi:hypothetical protein